MNKQSKRGLYRSVSLILLMAMAVSGMVMASAEDSALEADPYIATFSKSSAAGAPVTFSAEDFLGNLVGEAELKGIVITSLPAPESGTLYCGTREILVGEAVTNAGLDHLYFQPASADDTSAGFSFIPVFDGLTGQNTVITVSAMKTQNHAPMAENAEYETIKNIAVTCQFKGCDEDGDELIYQIETLPKKGDVAISDTSPGSFVYTPYQNKTGTDSFTYTATDPSGEKSEAGKITIKITKNSAKMTYSDMQDNSSHYAAIKLAEEGVLIGQRMGDSYFFSPEQTVSRGEFVAMALTCLGTEVVTPVSNTGFADDSDTPDWVKPYLSAALKNGIISGVKSTDGRMVFRANNNLTRAEAAVIIANALDLAGSESTQTISDLEAVPVWAAQATLSATASGILSVDSDGALRPMDDITRAEAAEMLWQAMEVMRRQASSGGLLSRIFG